MFAMRRESLQIRLTVSSDRRDRRGVDAVLGSAHHATRFRLVSTMPRVLTTTLMASSMRLRA
jgi:hypothetical protein